MDEILRKIKKQSRKECEQVLESKQPLLKLFDAKKFAGKLNWNGDAVKLQRQWRDE